MSHENEKDYLNNLLDSGNTEKRIVPLPIPINIEFLPVPISDLPRRRPLVIEKIEADYILCFPVNKHKTTWKLY